jgi:hypothetical protein
MSKPTQRPAAGLVQAALIIATLSSCTSEKSPPATTDAATISEPTDAAKQDASAKPDTAVEVGRSPVDVDEQPVDDAGETGGGAAGAGPLIDHGLWRMVTKDEDPFDDQSAQARCEITGVMTELLAEEQVFSVDTGLCNYLTVVQQTQRDIAVGERIKIRLWHFALSAPEPAEAHAAVMVDGMLALDERVPIPAQGGLLTREFRVERPIVRGAPVHFHLHNHGANSWSLVEVSVLH